MKILPAQNKSLRNAVQVLRRGGVVVFPTETSYGLAIDFINRRARAKLDRIKGRPTSKALTLIAADLAMVKAWVILSRVELAVARKFWPGPLTLLLRPRRRIGPNILSSNGLGIRVPGLAFARALAHAFGRPISATSANIAEADPAFSCREFLAQFAGQELPDLFLDAGRLPRRRPSTLAVIRDGKVSIVRRGPITKQQLACVIK